MQQLEVARQHRFSIEDRSNSLRILKRPVKPVVAIEPQSADLEEANILQESFAEGIQLEMLAFEFERDYFLRDDAFSAIHEMPVFLGDALRGYASSKSVKGLVAITGEESSEILIKVVRDPSVEEADTERIKLSVIGINLQMHNVYTEWVDMQGRPFESLEKDIRDEVAQTPGVMLAGIFRFTD